MKNIIINMMLVLAVVAVLAVFAVYVRVGTTPDCVTVFRSSGMIGAECPEKIARVLEMEKGVASSRVDAGSGQVVVWYDSCAVKPERLASCLAGAGFANRIISTVPVAKYLAMGGAKADYSRGCCRISEGK